MSTATGTVSSGTREFTLARLRSSEAVLLEQPARVPEGERNLQPASGGLPVLEILEHLAITEARSPKRLSDPDAVGAPAERIDNGALIARALNRTHGFSAPEALHPKGQFS